MRYMSVCSGIEAATVAWHSLGWEPVLFAEIGEFPSRLLDYYYPWVPNLGDMTQLIENEYFQKIYADLLVGGTPCQSFSVAGLRGGLDTANGNLALVFCRILLSKQPTWFVWENVPGVFSTNGGRDFLSILGGFQECGYSVAYRVFDSQYFGVPQRRRRVFVVGCIGKDWRPPVAVLFERESLCRDFTPCRGAREKIAEPLEPRTTGCCLSGEESAIKSQVIAIRKGNTSSNGIGINQTGTAYTLDTTGPCHIAAFNPGAGVQAGSIGLNKDIVPTLKGSQGDNAIPAIFQQNSRDEVRYLSEHGQIAGALAASLGMKQQNYLHGATIRRLTPLECERLQGFPDNYTKIPGASDSARYKAIGNSMTVQVMHWIGERIQRVDSIIKTL